YVETYRQSPSVGTEATAFGFPHCRIEPRQGCRKSLCRHAGAVGDYQILPHRVERAICSTAGTQPHDAQGLRRCEAAKSAGIQRAGGGFSSSKENHSSENRSGTVSHIARDRKGNLAPHAPFSIWWRRGGSVQAIPESVDLYRRRTR